MSIFDGMSGILNDVLGDPVIIHPSDALPTTVQAVFRREPIEVQSDEGEPILILAPTLKVRRDLVPNIARDDLVAPSIAPGQQYRVVNALPSGSPAADGFLICELEEVI